MNISQKKSLEQNNQYFGKVSNKFLALSYPIHSKIKFSAKEINYSTFFMSLAATILKYDGSTKTGDYMLGDALKAGYKRTFFFRAISWAEDNNLILCNHSGYKNSRNITLRTKGLSLFRDCFLVTLDSRDDKEYRKQIIFGYAVKHIFKDVPKKAAMADLLGWNYKRLEYNPEFYKEHKTVSQSATLETSQSETLETSQCGTNMSQSGTNMSQSGILKSHNVGLLCHKVGFSTTVPPETVPPEATVPPETVVPETTLSSPKPIKQKSPEQILWESRII